MYAKVIIITWSEFLSFDWQAAWAIFFSSYHIFSLVVRRALRYLIDKTGYFFTAWCQFGIINAWLKPLLPSNDNLFLIGVRISMSETYAKEHLTLPSGDYFLKKAAKTVLCVETGDNSISQLFFWAFLHHRQPFAVYYKELDRPIRLTKWGFLHIKSMPSTLLHPCVNNSNYTLKSNSFFSTQ